MKKHKCSHCGSIFIQSDKVEVMIAGMCAGCGYPIDDFPEIDSGMNMKEHGKKGIYEWSNDGRLFPYTSEYEHAFLEFLDKQLHMASSDVRSINPLSTHDKNIISL